MKLCELCENERDIQVTCFKKAIDRSAYVSWWSADETAKVDASCGLHSTDVIGSLWYLKCATSESSFKIDKPMNTMVSDNLN